MTKKSYFGWFIVFIILLPSTLMCSCGGGDNNVLPATVTVIGMIVDPVGGYGVPDSSVTVRDTNQATLSGTKSLPDGSYSVIVPSGKDIYINVSKPGYASMNTQVYNFTSDMQGNLPIIPAVTGKYMADAFSDHVLGNTWSDASYSGTCWLALDISDTSNDEVKGITVTAEESGPTIVYNNGSDVFMSTAPTRMSFNEPLVGGFGASSGVYTIFLTDELGNSQDLRIPLVPGEITYAFAEWQAVWGYSVSGKVTTTSGSGVAGVTVSLVTGSYAPEKTTTDKNGNYTITNQINGTYSITPSCSVDCSFTPAMITAAIVNGNVIGKNFVIDESTMPLTADATYVSDNSATLNGSYTNPFGETTSAWFEYGTTGSYGNIAGSVQLDSAAGTITAEIAGLSQLTTYHYRIVTSTAGLTFYGDDKTFTTLKTPEVIVSGLNSPKFLAVDASNVYWTDYSSVSKVSKNDRIVTILAFNLNDPWAIAVDATNVYWSEYYGFAIKKVSINGGAVTTLASAGNDYGIAIDADNVYWNNPYISKVSKNGGAVTHLADSIGTGIAVDSKNVYWTEYGVGGAVKKVALTGGSEVTIATADFANSIAVDSTSVYYPDGGLIKKIGIDGGTVTSLTSEHHGVYVLAIDSTYVYWIESLDWGAALKKVSKEGGTIVTLAQLASDNYYGIALDDTYVYWAASGEIKRIPKSY
jgi:hypothetical protein